MVYTMKEADFDSYGLKDMRWKHMLRSLSGPGASARLSSTSDRMTQFLLALSAPTLFITGDFQDLYAEMLPR